MGYNMQTFLCLNAEAKHFFYLPVLDVNFGRLRTFLRKPVMEFVWIMAAE